MVEQNVERLEVTVEDRLVGRVQIVYSLCDVKSELFPIVPSHLDLHVVEQAPKRTSRAILQYDAEVGHLGAGSQEEDDVRVADHFHNGALVLELFKLVLLNDLSFDLLDGDHCVLPTATVHDTIATFAQLTVVAQVSEWNFIVLDKCSGLVRNEVISSVLLVLYQCLFELALEVLWVGSCTLQLLKDLPLVRIKLLQGCSFCRVEDTSLL